MSDNNYKLEIVRGDGKNLEISSVSKHLSISKPKPISKINKNIIIPTEKIPKKKQSEEK